MTSTNGRRAAARRRIRAGSAPARAGCSWRRRACAPLPRTQPFCTKVSLPSGLTSLIVACRSTLGAEERTQALTAPAPITVVSPASGVAEVGDGAARRALFPLVGGRRGPEPAVARGGVAGEVGGRQRVGVPGEPVGAGIGRRLVAEAAVRREVPGPGLGPRDRELVEGLLRSRGRAGRARGRRRRCRTGPSPASGPRRRPAPARRSAAAGSGRAAGGRPATPIASS